MRWPHQIMLLSRKMCRRLFDRLLPTQQLFRADNRGNAAIVIGFAFPALIGFAALVASVIDSECSF